MMLVQSPDGSLETLFLCDPRGQLIRHPALLAMVLACATPTCQDRISYRLELESN